MLDLRASDVACVPVVRLDGTSAVLTFAETLSQASEIADLDDNVILPQDRDAMLRFLISIATVIARDTPRPVLKQGTFDQGAVDSFFSTYADRFDLYGDTPFMQEWGIDREALANAKTKFAPLSSINCHYHTEAKGEDVEARRYWGFIEDFDVTEPTHLIRCLIAMWFHSTANNTQPPKELLAMKPISGAPSGPGGWSTSFFMIGQTLAQTLLLNIEKPWLSMKDLPAWLDQRAKATKDHDTTTRSIWHSTFTPTRLILAWEDGVPVGVVRGMTYAPFPGTDPDPKRDALHNSRRNPNRIWEFDQEKPQKADDTKAGRETGYEFLSLTESLTGLRSAARWYRESCGRQLDTWRIRSRAIKSDRETLRVGISIRETRTDSRKYLHSTFETFEYSRLVAEDSIEREQEQVMADLVVDLTGNAIDHALRPLLAGGKDVGAKKLIDTTRTALYRSLDQRFSRYWEETDRDHDDREAEADRLSKMARAAADDAIGGFGSVMDSLQTPQTVASIAQAKVAYRIKAYAAAKKARIALHAAAEPENAPSEGEAA